MSKEQKNQVTIEITQPGISMAIGGVERPLEVGEVFTLDREPLWASGKFKVIANPTDKGIVVNDVPKQTSVEASTTAAPAESNKVDVSEVVNKIVTDLKPHFDHIEERFGEVGKSQASVRELYQDVQKGYSDLESQHKASQDAIAQQIAALTERVATLEKTKAEAPQQNNKAK